MTAEHVDIWNAWIHKNEEKDKAHFQKLARVAGLAFLIGMACLLIWAWTQQSGKAFELASQRMSNLLDRQDPIAPAGETNLSPEGRG